MNPHSRHSHDGWNWDNNSRRDTRSSHGNSSHGNSSQRDTRDSQHIDPSTAVMGVILEIWGSLGQNGAAYWPSTTVLASTFGDLARSFAIWGGMLVL